ncbi:MAG: hypothetical protein ALECFALPRED_008489 [Alectoria fallacina]|uniref:Uncharacterized protein n=1 Tax=Alectoria fallacina TaxID=1903189 RepID=A0A8H3J3U6_9LECA|nr:MAG: hypothetical protein ALECFALPRED_008489 [Alectoria fallacina]
MLSSIVAALPLLLNALGSALPEDSHVQLLLRQDPQTDQSALQDAAALQQRDIQYPPMEATLNLVERSATIDTSNDLLTSSWQDSASGDTYNISYDGVLCISQTIGYYVFLNGTLTEDATYQEISEDIRAADQSQLGPHVLEQAQGLLSEIESLFDNGWICNGGSGSGRNLLYQYTPGDITALMVKSAAGGYGISMAVTFLNSENSTLTASEKGVIAGFGAGLGLIANALVDYLQGRLLAPLDAIVISLWIGAASIISNVLGNDLNNVCFTDDQIQSAFDGVSTASDSSVGVAAYGDAVVQLAQDSAAYANGAGTCA